MAHAVWKEKLMSRLGLITIGQTPRPDIEALFRQHIPDATIRIAGALDGMSPRAIAALATPGYYPLLVRLADGTTAQIPRDRLVPLVAEQAQRLAAAGATLIVVLCAGGFPDIDCRVPVLLPGKIVPGVVQSITRTRRIGVVTPLAEQMPAAQAKWEQDGFQVQITWASPLDHSEIEHAAALMRDPDLEVVVLDCMGHSAAYQQDFARQCGRPVILAQSLVARIVGELLVAEEGANR
jgi:protein AroM